MGISNLSGQELRPQFDDPPAKYGPIDCWWWEAGKLDKERMTWQLEEMKRKGISGTWFYPRLIYGEALAPTPAYWTDEWWEFFRFSMQEHRRLGLTAWTSDWTAAEYFQFQLRDQREQEPWLTGRRLAIHKHESTGSGQVSIQIPANQAVLDAAAFEKTDRGLDETTRQPVELDGRELLWHAPTAGWVLTAVVSEPYDLDYLNRDVTERWIDVLLGEHERRVGEYLGSPLQAYGTDELVVLQGNILVSEELLARFETERGYDPRPLLAGMFLDVGRRTEQIRCQYYDLMVSMLEENLYRPFADWLHQRGMLYTEFCPNGKWVDMLGQTYHYGDFYRYMRHYDYPGNEEDTNRTRTFQAKLVSSIAHLYEKRASGPLRFLGLRVGAHSRGESGVDQPELRLRHQSV